jgi:glycosyltransferase involved in cell wall biosynthesis
MTPRVSLVVLAYNEADNLEPAVRELHGGLSRLTDPVGSDPEPWHEIVIVDDGSRDGTGALADRLAGDLRGLRVIHHDANQGLGGGYRTGFAEAQREYITFFPADGQFPASILQLYYPLMTDHDLVLGYLPGRDPSWAGRMLSGAERFLYRMFFGYIPRFQGIFMLRRSLLPGLGLESSGRGWGIVMEMMLKVHRRGFRVISVPIDVRPRRSGQSKVRNLRTVWINLKQSFAVRRAVRQ